MENWKKQLPDKTGWWVRLNAIHKPEVHEIAIDAYDRLCMAWGWGGEQKVCPLEDIKERLESFYWQYLGDLPERKMPKHLSFQAAKCTIEKVKTGNTTT